MVIYKCIIISYTNTDNKSRQFFKIFLPRKDDVFANEFLWESFELDSLSWSYNAQ